MIPRRSRAIGSFCVRTFIPGSTVVVHDAGNPRRPSICTTHSRHEPNASSESVAHSFGTFTPDCAAARITEVPAGTVTGVPSISSVTSVADSRAGVPASGSLTEYMRSPPLAPSSAGNPRENARAR